MFITKNLQGVEEGNLSATLTPSWTVGTRDRLYELSCNLAPLNQLLGVVLWGVIGVTISDRWTSGSRISS